MPERTQIALLTRLVVRETVGRGKSFQSFRHVDPVPSEDREWVLEVLHRAFREVLGYTVSSTLVLNVSCW